MKRYLVKRKNKKGFTLIELLAVILILGIIALIAIPTVNGVIEEARRGAFDTGTKSIEKAVEELVITKQLDGDSSTNLTDGNYDIKDLVSMGLNVKNVDKYDGSVTIKNDKVFSFNLYDGNYREVKYNDDYSIEKYRENFINSDYAFVEFNPFVMENERVQLCFVRGRVEADKKYDLYMDLKFNYLDYHRGYGWSDVRIWDYPTWGDKVEFARIRTYTSGADYLGIHEKKVEELGVVAKTTSDDACIALVDSVTISGTLEATNIRLYESR